MVAQNKPSAVEAAASPTRPTSIQPARSKKETEIVFDPPKSEMKIIRLHQIDPNVWNSRLEIDERSASFLELQSSVLADGLHEPLVITPKKDPKTGEAIQGKFDLVAGHRRYRALLKCGHAQTWCNIKYFTHDIQVILTNIQENILREPLRPFEVASSCKKLRDMGYSVKQISVWVHKSEGYVGRLTQLLEKLVPQLIQVFSRHDNEATVKQLYEISHKAPEEQLKHYEAIKEGRPLTEVVDKTIRPLPAEPSKETRPKIRNRDAVRLLLGDIKCAKAFVVKGRAVPVEKMTHDDFLDAYSSLLRWTLRELDKYPVVLPEGKKEPVDDGAQDEEST